MSKNEVFIKFSIEEIDSFEAVFFEQFSNLLENIEYLDKGEVKLLYLFSTIFERLIEEKLKVLYEDENNE